MTGNFRNYVNELLVIECKGLQRLEERDATGKATREHKNECIFEYLLQKKGPNSDAYG